MAKLTDTQAILLSAAAARDDLSLYPLPASHANGGVRVTKALAALLKGALAEERETRSTEAVHRSDGDRRFSLHATRAGLTALGIAPEPVTLEQQPDEAPAPAAAPARVTKAALVLGLLRREGGATLPELIAATGWLPHTTRAALTGLRKTGHGIERGTRDGATCYRIVAAG